MTGHRTGTREEWQAARDELAGLEAEHAELGTQGRREAARVAVGRGAEGVRVRHAGRQEDARRAIRRTVSAACLQHHVRARLLGRRVPRVHTAGRRARGHAGAPGAPRRDAHLLSTRAHRSPDTYKQRMGWTFPYVSTYGSDFPFDFGLALSPEQAAQVPRSARWSIIPLGGWRSGLTGGARLQDGLRESPSYIVFARENGTIYHTYTVMAPDRSSRRTRRSCSTAHPSSSPRSRGPSARTSIPRWRCEPDFHSAARSGATRGRRLRETRPRNVHSMRVRGVVEHARRVVVGRHGHHAY